jgi:hypothetical protein
MAIPSRNRNLQALRCLDGNVGDAVVGRCNRCSAVQTFKEINPVGNWRKENADDLEDSIFANNPFLDDLLEWRHSPEGQRFAELADALCDLLEDVQLDAKQRKFIWPDGQRLDLDQSVAHVQKQYPDFRRDWIEEYLNDWIDMDYAPEHYSEAQLDELDKLTARWIADHKRRAKAAKRQGRTRHS